MLHWSGSTEGALPGLLEQLLLLRSNEVVHVDFALHDAQILQTADCLEDCALTMLMQAMFAVQPELHGLTTASLQSSSRYICCLSKMTTMPPASPESLQCLLGWTEY